MLRPSRFEPCFGVGKCNPIAFLIYYKEQIAFVDELVVVYTDVVNVAGNVRSNTDNPLLAVIITGESGQDLLTISAKDILPEPLK